MAEFELRLRRIYPNGSSAGILPHQSIDWTCPLGDISTLSATVSTAVTGALPEILELAVELFDGTRWFEPVNARVIAQSRTTDELDQSGIVDLTGVNIVSWLMSKAVLEVSGSDARPIEGSVGSVLNTLLSEALNRGWGTRLEFDFTATTDSNGLPWGSNSHVDIELEPGQTYSTILAILRDMDALEWSTQGRTLRVFRPGTGTDRSAGSENVQLGLTATELPVESSIADLATVAMILGDGARYIYPVQNPIQTGYGRLEIAVNAGGVTKGEQAAIIAAPITRAGARPRNSYTVTENATLAPRPHIDYELGDWVSVRRDGRFERMRVVEVQVRVSGNTTTIDVVLEDRITSQIASLTQRAAAIGRLGGNRSLRAGSSAYSGGGGGASLSYGVVASPAYGEGGKVRVIADGATEPGDPLLLDFLRSYAPSAGDRIAHVGSMIMGRVTGLVDPVSQWQEPVLSEERWPDHLPEEYGPLTLTKTSTGWVLPDGNLSVPEGGNFRSMQFRFPGGMRPVEDINFDTTVLWSWTISEGGVYSDNGDGRISRIRFNNNSLGLTALFDTGGNPLGVAYGVDEHGMAYGVGRGNADGRQFPAPGREVRVSRAGSVMADGTLTYVGPDEADKIRYSLPGYGLDWVQMDLINGWQHSTVEADGPVEVTKRPDDIVVIRGAGVGGLSPFSAAAVIPEGMRPKYRVEITNGYVLPNGEVYLQPMPEGTPLFHEMWLADH